MPKETASHINQLVATNPDGADPKTQGDDHIRMIKQVLLTDFPNIAGAVTADHTELSYCDGVTSAIQTQLNAKAPLASPALTGVPTVPTAAADTNTTQAASTAFVVGQAGSSSPTMNGTATVGTSKRYARDDHVHPTDTSRAPLASPALTGTPTVPTAATGTNTTQAASTAFVQNQIASSVPTATDTVYGKVKFATLAEAQNLLNYTTTMTPQLVDLSYTGANQGSGWQRLPGGIYLQWVSVAKGDISAGATWSATFPIAFPNFCSSVMFSMTDTSASCNVVACMTSAPTRFGASGSIGEIGAATQNVTLHIFAIGY